MSKNINLTGLTVDTADGKTVVAASKLVRLLDHSTHLTVYGSGYTNANGAVQISVADSVTQYCIEIDGEIAATDHNVGLGWLSTDTPNPYFLAASNATLTEKAWADTICDGTADEADINAAWAINKHLILSSGTFNVAAKVAYVQYGLLEGQGIFNTIIKRAGNFSDYIISGSGQVTIKNLQVDGDKYTYTGNYGGIWAENADYSLIEDVYVHHTRMHGITIRSASDNAKLIRVRCEECGVVTLTDDGTGTGTFVAGETVRLHWTTPVPATAWQEGIVGSASGHAWITLHDLGPVPTLRQDDYWYVLGEASGATMKALTIVGNSGYGIAVIDSPSVEIQSPILDDNQWGITFVNSPYWKLTDADITTCVKGDGLTADKDSGVGLVNGLRINGARAGVTLDDGNHRIYGTDIANIEYHAMQIAGSYCDIRPGRHTGYGNNGIDDGIVFGYKVVDGVAVGSKYNTITGGVMNGANHADDFGLTQGHTGFYEAPWVELVGTVTGTFQNDGSALGEKVTGGTSATAASWKQTLSGSIIIQRWLQEAAATKVKYIRGIPVVGETFTGAISGATIVVDSINYLVDYNTFTGGKALGHNTLLGADYTITGPASRLDVPLTNTSYSSGTRCSGTATVPNGATYIAVAHSLRRPPARVRVTPTNNLGNAVMSWVPVANLAYDTLRITVDADPGVGTATFTWEAER